MSAFTVPRAHVAAIVRALAARDLINITQTTGVADDLMRENCRSVAYRYREEPETFEPFTAAEIATARKLSHAEAINAVQCLDHQSCEPPDWEQTTACALLKRLQGHALEHGGEIAAIRARNSSIGCWPIHDRGEPGKPAAEAARAAMDANG